MNKFFEVFGVLSFVLLACAGIGYCLCKLTGNEDLIEEFKDRMMEGHTCSCGDDCGCGCDEEEIVE